ncbi:MAG: hypothetical protein WCD38_08545 [Candidatus Tumulicola sp.]
MTPFDYLTVLVSIVIGLAIANVLTRLSVVITARERVDFYWPPVAWAIWLFFVAVQHWWAQWSVRHTREWNFGTFCLELAVPVLLFFISALVLPEREENGRLDLGEWYFHNRAWFFAALFFVPAASLAEELTRTGHIASPVNLAFLLFFEVTIAAAYALKSRRIQEIITAQAMAMTLLYVIVLFIRLPG